MFGSSQFLSILSRSVACGGGLRGLRARDQVEISVQCCSAVSGELKESSILEQWGTWSVQAFRESSGWFISQVSLNRRAKWGVVQIGIQVGWGFFLCRVSYPFCPYKVFDVSWK